jgi:hypothetical protein
VPEIGKEGGDAGFGAFVEQKSHVPATWPPAVSASCATSALA